MSTSKSIFFHVGLGKTGTTFLQYRAFPYFKNLQYIQRTKYRKAKRIIRGSSAERFFMSHECDQQLQSVAKDWAADFPDTQIIIMFRRHDSWIASQYRRFAKNGNVKSFEELYDVIDDSGKFKHHDLHYMRMIRMLEETFSVPPLVLIYDDMKKDVKGFISFLASHMDSNVVVDQLNLSSKHSSYSEKQLKAFMKVNRYIGLNRQRLLKNRTLEFIRRLGGSALRYTILYAAKLTPESWYDDQPLIDPDALAAVKARHEGDWNQVLKRATRI